MPHVTSIRTLVPSSSEPPDPEYVFTALASGVLASADASEASAETLGTLRMKVRPWPGPERRPFTGWMSSVYVAPGARGEGVGEALFKAAIEAARAEGCETCGLLVTVGNPAVRLYERLGFRPCWPDDGPLVAYVLHLE